jgi:HPt (histidine-containing phosphotransfer) domain-containing protein
MTKLKKLKNKGINVESGLYYCNGNEALYIEILAEVLEESAEKRALFEECAASGDIKGYYREAHALKNVSATIGSDDLTKFLGGLCAHIKSSNILPPPGHLRELLAKYDEVLNIIEDVL